MKRFSWVAGAILLGIILVPGLAKAHEDVPGAIRGEKIELFVRSHAFAGSILDTPVYGTLGGVGTQVQMRRGQNDLTLNFEKKDNTYFATLTETRQNSAGETQSLNTRVDFVSVKRTAEKDGIITIKIDGQTVDVQVKGDSFKNNHFQNPKFEANVGGQTIAFILEGEACFGFSAHLSMMIFGTYTHLKK